MGHLGMYLNDISLFMMSASCPKSISSNVDLWDVVSEYVGVGDAEQEHREGLHDARDGKFAPRYDLGAIEEEKRADKVDYGTVEAEQAARIDGALDSDLECRGGSCAEFGAKGGFECEATDSADVAKGLI